MKKHFLVTGLAAMCIAIIIPLFGCTNPNNIVAEETWISELTADKYSFTTEPGKDVAETYCVDENKAYSYFGSNSSAEKRVYLEKVGEQTWVYNHDGQNWVKKQSTSYSFEYLTLKTLFSTLALEYSDYTLTNGWYTAENHYINGGTYEAVKVQFENDKIKRIQLVSTTHTNIIEFNYFNFSITIPIVD